VDGPALRRAHRTHGGIIKFAAGASAYLIEQANRTRKAHLEDWYDGIIDGTGLHKNDSRLVFRRTMFTIGRRQAGMVQRRRDTREHGGVKLIWPRWDGLGWPRAGRWVAVFADVGAPIQPRWPGSSARRLRGSRATTSR
jgi:hypothetical protein